QKGFDPAFTKEDLGTGMLGLCIRHCIEANEVCAFDFMGGGAVYKQLWARQSRDNVELKLLRPNVRAQVYAVQERAGNLASSLARVCVPASLRAVLRDQIRRWQRRRSDLAHAGTVMDAEAGREAARRTANLKSDVLLPWKRS